jgi:hypothetical protein
LKDWVIGQYSSGSDYKPQDKEPRLLSLDVFAPQMTKLVLDEFKKLNCTTSFIPGGCTGFIQVLNIALNQPLKELVKQAADDHYNANIELYKTHKFSVRD